MLKIEDLKVNYGGIEAVKGITFDVAEGSIVTLIGANGAGKSTMLRTISGLVKAESGSVTYNDKELIGLAPNKILEQGVALVPRQPGSQQPVLQRQWLQFRCGFLLQCWPELALQRLLPRGQKR